MGDEVADEGDWYAALVAGEHVGDWLDTVRNAKIPPGRRTRAASQLAEKVAADPSAPYVVGGRYFPRPLLMNIFVRSLPSPPLPVFLYNMELFHTQSRAE